MFEEPIIVKDETIVCNVDLLVPIAYIKKPPFPIRIKEHAKARTMIHKSNIKTPNQPGQIKVEPSIAMIKDLLVDNTDGYVIYFCDEAARIAKQLNIEQDKLDKNRPVVGMPVVSIKIRDH